jgi:hypothetical protein
MDKPISLWNSQDLSDAVNNGTATVIDPEKDKDWVAKLVSTKTNSQDSPKK